MSIAHEHQDRDLLEGPPPRRQPIMGRGTHAADADAGGSASRRRSGSIADEDVRDAIDHIVRGAEGGDGPTLLVRGERGLGKTTVLERAIESAAGFRIIRVDGLDVEKDLAFAGLHRFCEPLQGDLDRLPQPQRDALSTTFGGSAGVADPLLLGLAVLDLLVDDRPIVCVVDDAQWIDRPTRRVLAFVARRLATRRVAMIFASDQSLDDLGGVAELRLRPLSDADARELLASAIPGPLDHRVRDRMIAESRGNPRALADAARGSTPWQLAGGFGVPAAPPANPLAAHLRARVRSLPHQARLLLLLAAAEPEGETALLRRACAHLAIDADVAAQVESSGLLELGDLVTFPEPLIRSVVYHDADQTERRRVHRTLADATDAEASPHRQVWHRAHAAPDHDAELAEALERSTGAAHDRGGRAAVAAFLELAVRLTSDPVVRATRALDAAYATFESGSVSEAAQLANLAAHGPLDEQDRARSTLLGAEIELAARGAHGALPRFLDAAKAFERLDIRTARIGYLRALEVTGMIGEIDAGSSPLAGAARRAVPREPLSPPDLLLDAVSSYLLDSPEVAVPKLRRAVDAHLSADHTCWFGLTYRLALELWDMDAASELAVRSVRTAREAGALATLPVALHDLAVLRVHRGDIDDAARLVADADACSNATGSRFASHGALEVAAWSGDEVATLALVEGSRREAHIRGEGRLAIHADIAVAVLFNGLGRYRDALTAIRSAYERTDVLACWVLPEAIEAAFRSGDTELARQVSQRLTAAADLATSEWARGIAARCNALVADVDGAEALYGESIERLRRCGATAHAARAHLLFGEWLRRQRRRREARQHLRLSEEMFVAMQATGFAARAHRELLATSERARTRSVETTTLLTPQEAEIADLARKGFSNPEIGERLYISGRTVEYHLHKVFRKLDISSRVQLASALPGEHGRSSGSPTVRRLVSPPR